MSASCRVEWLEAFVARELSPAQSGELDAHLARCARCRHELNWLRTEHALFAQRAARDEVNQLLALRPRADVRTWSMTALAFALVATALLWVASSRVHPSASSGARDDEEGAVAFESQEQSTVNCSTLQPGFGFSCGPMLLATFR